MVLEMLVQVSSFETAQLEGIADMFFEDKAQL